MHDKGQATYNKLRQLARKRRVSTELLLTRWAMERFLHRLSQSPYQERFILKGALLLTVWEGDLPRVTRDVDLHGLERDDIRQIRVVRRG